MNHTTRSRIEALLPHREPFLFVDEIVEEGEDGLSASWRVPEDLDAFRGHYPGNPVLPGVLIAEHCFQVGALLIYTTEEDGGSEGTPVLARIEDARFRRIVRPGETLATRVSLRERLANARYLTAQVHCGAERVARIDFALALAAEEQA